MIIRIPDALTIHHSEEYIVSIRLWPDGFSFSGHSPSLDDSFFHTAVPLEADKPYSTSLQELLDDNACLKWPYKKLLVQCGSPQYSWIPREGLDDKQKAELFAFTFSTPQQHCVADRSLPGSSDLLFGMDRDIHSLCCQQLRAPQFRHYLSAPVQLWMRQTGKIQLRALYVLFHAGRIDLIGLNEGQLLFCNSFRVRQPEDAVYYILYVWQQLGFDVEKDSLFLGGEEETEAVRTFITSYVRHVNPITVPSEAYLLGTQLAQVPIDLISLFICES
ncbi:MAG: DUF3822 family protein [Parabacteroides sp.]